MFMVGFFSGKFILANDPVPSFGKIFLFVVVMATIFMAPYFILKYREENKESWYLLHILQIDIFLNIKEKFLYLE